MNNNNYAYDPWKNKNTAPKVEREAAEKPELIRVNEIAANKEAVWGYLKILACVAIAVACFFAVMSGYIKCNELDIEIGRKTETLSQLKSEHTRLQAEIERKQSRDIIEKYATDVLGMQPVQDYQKNTIKIERKDTLTAPKQEGEKGSLKDYIGGMFSK